MPAIKRVTNTARPNVHTAPAMSIVRAILIIVGGTFFLSYYISLIYGGGIHRNLFSPW